MWRYDKAQPRIGSQVWQQVETLIREEWSPEQIVGRIAMELGVSLSHEWIYQYIYSDQHSGGNLNAQPAVPAALLPPPGKISCSALVLSSSVNGSTIVPRP